MRQGDADELGVACSRLPEESAATPTGACEDILKLEATRLADEPPQAVRGAGVEARTDAITRTQDGG
ncbi:hypothetical protein ACFT7S_15955 [Streptomyces sp. NPDC057136]|uniref:hypothetical protein n=1 Tax=Streptomyces sp. NPDC057136 TaxID=3346029 RepID=UPI00362CF242